MGMSWPFRRNSGVKPPHSKKAKRLRFVLLKSNRFKVAEPTGLEPATSDVTGRRSNQLNYDSARTEVGFQRSDVSVPFRADL